MKNILCSFLILTLLIGCDKKEPAASPEVQAYINEVVTLLKAKSVNRKNIDWDKFKASVLKHAEKAVSIQDAYPSVEYAVTQLHDHHSYFAAANNNEDSEKAPPTLTDETVPSDIGYIRIPYCMGDEDQLEAYRNKVLEQLKERDKANLKGWIVDLRGNFGGNMSPMLTGIAPVLGSGIVGYFIDPDNNAEPWICKDGKVLYGTTTIEDIHEFYSLKKANPYVAVLTDSLTASSGEAVAVAFKGRPKTRSFGTKTFGVSSSNEVYILSDGARINLTVSTFADRNKQKYGSSIIPDQKCAPEKTLEEAVKWLQKNN